jgi:MFS family permease
MAGDLAMGKTERRRPAFLSYDRNVYLMLLYTLGKGLQLSIGALTINLYAYSLGFHQDFIGLLTGMPALGSFVAGVPIGLLADRIGRRPLILTSAALTPLTLVAVGLSANAPLLLIASFINGLLASAYWVTNLPMLTESSTPQQRVSVLALNSFLLLGVGALGSLIGGIVPELAARLTHQAATSVIPLRWGVLAAAFVAAVPALPLVLLREPRGPTPNSSPSPMERGTDAPVPAPPAADAGTEAGVALAATEPATAASSYEERWPLPILFIMLLLPDVIFVVGESSVVGLEQLFFRLRFNLHPGPLGIFIALAGLGGGISALIAPRLARRWGKLRVATSMQMAGVPVVLAIGFAPVLGLAVAAEVARNVLRGLFEPTYAAFTMESVSSKHRATLSGFYGITWGVGYSLGAAIAGFLQEHVGLAAPFAVGALCLALAPTLLLAFFSRRPLTASPG